MCGLPLQAGRLAAVPNAMECVPCLEAQGDVPKLKLVQEPIVKGDEVDMVELIFTDKGNPYAADFVNRGNAGAFLARITTSNGAGTNRY